MRDTVSPGLLGLANDARIQHAFFSSGHEAAFSKGATGAAAALCEPQMPDTVFNDRSANLNPLDVMVLSKERRQRPPISGRKLRRYLIHHEDRGTWDLLVDGDRWAVEYQGRAGTETFTLAEFEKSRVGERLAPNLWAAIVRAMNL